MDNRTFWSFHQCLPGKLEYGEWLFADTSLKRLKRKIMFEKIPLGKEDFIFIMWNGYTMRGANVGSIPEGGFYNIQVYGTWSFKLSQEEFSDMLVWRTDRDKGVGAIRDYLVKKRIKDKMAREVFHICYNTEKERKEIIRKIQFKDGGRLSMLSADCVSYSLYNLFNTASDLKKEDPFKFMLMVHNTTFETIEIHDSKVVNSVYVYHYKDLSEKFWWLLRGF